MSKHDYGTESSANERRAKQVDEHAESIEPNSDDNAGETPDRQTSGEPIAPAWTGRLGLDIVQSCFPAVGVLVALPEHSLGRTDFLLFFAVFGSAFLLYLTAVKPAKRTDFSIWTVFLMTLTAGLAAGLGSFPAHKSFAPLMVIASWVVIRFARRLERFLEPEDDKEELPPRES